MNRLSGPVRRFEWVALIVAVLLILICFYVVTVPFAPEGPPG